MNESLRKDGRAHDNWQRHIESVKLMLSKVKPYDEKNTLQAKHKAPTPNQTQVGGAE